MEETRQTKTQTAKGHKLALNNRSAGTVSGVKDVISFDLKEILLDTDAGMLTINGENLHISRLTLEKGEVDVEGQVDSLTYSDSGKYARQGESILARLFK